MVKINTNQHKNKIIMSIIKNVFQMIRTCSLLVPLIEELAPANRA
jgi:hypothetical protein